jgi:aminopeptidase N
MHAPLTARLALAAAAALSIAARAAHAQPPAGPPAADPRIDPATGRDLANWPHDRPFDHLHMRLSIDVHDLNDKRFTATAELRISAIAVPRSTLTLDARPSITVSTVAVNGEPARFSHENAKLTITLPKPALPGTPIDVRVDYTATEPSKDGLGLNWFKGRPSSGSRAELAPQIHSQGQAAGSSFWFPCHDFPNERLTTEVLVTVEDGFETLSNGRLLGKKPAPPGKDAKPRTTWHWLQDKAHPNYLVTLVVGKFDVVEVGGPNTKRPGLEMPVYGPPGSAAGLRSVFANVPAMVAFFEEKFDEPYPWDKYAHAVVRNFRWGGMENTSATTLAEFAGSGNTGTHDDLLAHELAHQWFGDLVTCNAWEHLWLNEGWATFSEYLWAEHVGGPDAYQRKMLGSLGPQRATNRATAPADAPMVSNRYADPDDTFTKTDDVYAKGGLVLHMLRQRLGDEVFWKGARLYLDRYKLKTVQTDDFRRTLEEVSGQSLERFFDQWTRRPGIPRLAVDLEWNQAAKQLTVKVEQTQTINADNPAYALRIPIYCEFAEIEPRWVYLDTDERSKSATFTLPQRPRQVSVDPNVANAADLRVRRELALDLFQRFRGPTLAAREEAKDALAARVDSLSGAAHRVARAAALSALTLANHP